MKELFLIAAIAVVLSGCTANINKGYSMCDSADKYYDSVHRYQGLSWQALEKHEPTLSEIYNAEEYFYLDKTHMYIDSMNFYWKHKYEFKLATK